MTSRKLVYKTLDFNNKNNRVPRDLWALPWARLHYPNELQKIVEDFPSDFLTVDPCYQIKDKSEGDQHKAGRFVDAWGCIFESKVDGYIGEVKEAIVPLINEETDWNDISHVHFPVEWKSLDIDQVNAQCRNTDKFVIGSPPLTPFERLQFIRTSEQLFIDLTLMTSGLKSFIKKMHAFYCELLELWCKTDVDCFVIFDDWGTQVSLLIDPKLWRQIFKPMYKDYIEIAHRAGKRIFLHSDGYTLAIYPDFIELGFDAVNTQIFCMGIENLRQFAGKITFWGEIDRQNILPYATVDEVKSAVRLVKETLWQNGGAIAQCEFGAGSNPANIRAVFEAWEE
jgi:hypothetical protein